jgi:Terminase large subunit, T4likevirus-type, N-terminal
MQVYAEALTRTMATGTFQGGLILLLFTPLNGWSDVVESFLNPQKCSADRCSVRAAWGDVPHLSAAEKEAMLAAYPPYQRDPRSKGIPHSGSGAIYPLAESQIAVDPFLIPPSRPRVYGLDVWHGTLWLALGQLGRNLQKVSPPHPLF